MTLVGTLITANDASKLLLNTWTLLPGVRDLALVPPGMGLEWTERGVHTLGAGLSPVYEEADGFNVRMLNSIPPEAKSAPHFTEELARSVQGTRSFTSYITFCVSATRVVIAGSSWKDAFPRSENHRKFLSNLVSSGDKFAGE